MYCVVHDKPYLLTYKVNVVGMKLKLQMLARKYEIVVYSILPQNIIDQIVVKFPCLDTYVNHVLSFEHIRLHDKYAVKDLAYLRAGRLFHKIPTWQQSDIFLVKSTNSDKIIRSQM